MQVQAGSAEAVACALHWCKEPGSADAPTRNDCTPDCTMQIAAQQLQRGVWCGFLVPKSGERPFERVLGAPGSTSSGSGSGDWATESRHGQYVEYVMQAKIEIRELCDV